MKIVYLLEIINLLLLQEINCKNIILIIVIILNLVVYYSIF